MLFPFVSHHSSQAATADESAAIGTEVEEDTEQNNPDPHPISDPAVTRSEAVGIDMGTTPNATSSTDPDPNPISKNRCNPFGGSGD